MSFAFLNLSSIVSLGENVSIMNCDCNFQVEYVLHYYGIPQCVCFGVGLGANVLARFARRRPTMVDGLVLINCSSQVGGHDSLA